MSDVQTYPIVVHRGPNMGKRGEICWCGFQVNWNNPAHPHDQYHEHIRNVTGGEPMLTWDELRPYEQKQGGYWLHGSWCDAVGSGKVWVPVAIPV